MSAGRILGGEFSRESFNPEDGATRSRRSYSVGLSYLVPCVGRE